MGQAMINRHMQLDYPEGFRELTQEELQHISTAKEAPQWCIDNPEQQITLAVSWKEINPVVALLAGSKDGIKGMELRLRRSMQAYSYHLEQFVSRRIGGQKAEGFQYTYELKGRRMFSQTFIVKIKKTMYYMYYIQSRIPDSKRETSGQTLEEMLDSIRFA